MAERPDYSRSRAILIGTANYQDPGFTPLPAAANSVTAMLRLLTSDLCGWPRDRVTVLEDPTDARRVLQTLRRLARDTDDVLLVYYVGHGVLQRRAQLTLVLTDTDSDDSDLTGLEYQRIREILLDSAARVKIVILDCCYSGRAIEALAGEGIADSTETHGVYTLTASDRAAHVVPLDRQRDATTSFTGELVDLVRGGIPGEPERLTLGTLYPHLRRRLQRRALPTPNQRCTDTSDQFPFARNAAHLPPAAPAAQSPLPPRSRKPAAVPVPQSSPLSPTAVVIARWNSAMRRGRPASRVFALRRGRALVVLGAVVTVVAMVAVIMTWWPKDRSGGTGSTVPPGSTEPSGATGSPASPIVLNGSPTFDAMRARGRAIIGAKEDQPGLGFLDLTSGKRSGFDIEIAKLIAAKFGFAEDKIQFKTIASAGREQEIMSRAVDYYVGTYTINDKRKQQVSFAGPYFLAGQDLLVRKDEQSITGKDKLRGRKVCSVTGSTPIIKLQNDNLTESENIVQLSSYSQCVDKLLTNDVDALTTDDAILRGYASQEPNRLKVIGAPFTDEPYGVGILKDDAIFRTAVNTILQTALDDGTWDWIYSTTLGKSGNPSRKPTIQR